MSQRHEFVLLAGQAGANMRLLCRRFEISAKTGYKWLQRFRTEGAAGLVDRSRRPRHSPGICPEALAAVVVLLRRKHPRWGGRKLRRRLCDLGQRRVPSASTCTEIVRRADLIAPEASITATAGKRFERSSISYWSRRVTIGIFSSRATHSSRGHWRLFTRFPALPGGCVTNSRKAARA